MKNTPEVLTAPDPECHSAPHHWPELDTQPQPNGKGVWEMQGITGILVSPGCPVTLYLSK